MNVTTVLKQYNIEPNTSVNAAIRDVGLMIDGRPNRLEAANEIITALGAPAATKERTAIVLAKGLIEQAMIYGSEYKVEDAMTVVAGKYMKLVDEDRKSTRLNSSH